MFFQPLNPQILLGISTGRKIRFKILSHAIVQSCKNRKYNIFESLLRSSEKKSKYDSRPNISFKRNIEKHINRYLKNGVSKSIVHVIRHVNFAAL